MIACKMLVVSKNFSDWDVI